MVDVLVDHDLEALCREADRVLSQDVGRGGARHVLIKSELFRDLAEKGPPVSVARAVLGPSARPTKATLFDKTPGANWKVPWHQDLTLSVSHRADLEGFGPWTVKDGVHHVQPPVEILEQVLALRLHLDPTPEHNGALRVVPGSHRLGRLRDAEIDALIAEGRSVTCPVQAGGAMLMSPLLLHASSAADPPTRRRVLHLEYCAVSLPGDLDWA